MAIHQKQVPISSRNNRAARIAHAKASQQFRTYDTSAIQPKRSKAPVIFGIVIAIIILAVAAVIAFNFLSKPKVELLSSGEEAVVNVQTGESAKDIASSLLNARLITDEGAFVDLVKNSGSAGSLIPGTYVFQGGSSMDSILNALTVGPAATGYKLVIPEGYTRQKIADEIQEVTKGRITSQAFMNATANASAYANDYSFLESVGTNSLEGFLFPKTYTVTVTDDADKVVRMMLDQFRTETINLNWSYPISQDLDEYDAIILASIVEKEGKSNTYDTVASVFYNRLASERPYLESDATTAYEVGHDPTPDEVHADSPYSTYTNAGLPPTPICNPSLVALQAVCQPEETDYMYFYTHDDGSYAFSATLDEHASNYL